MKGVRRNVVALGLVSLLNDASSEMIFPLLPMFLVSLGAGAAALGAVEGIADGVAAVMKYAAGAWSDRTARKKPFLLFGYGLAGLTRPLIALATAPLHVVALRSTDRLGKGVRTSPRDALLAASVPASERGRAFGLHRAMDHAGAIVGPLLALGVLAGLTTHLPTVFLLATLPAVLAVVVLVVFVREAEPGPPEPEVAVAEAPAHLWRFLLPMGVFTLGNASDAFLMLAAGVAHESILVLPALWLALHVVKSASSPVGGWLVDRVGARPTIVLGWLWYAGSYGLLAVVRDPTWVAAVVLLYGVHHGLSEPAEKTWVADRLGKDKRGTAFGAYHLTVGLAAVPASIGFGLVWEAVGQGAAFAAGAALAAAATVLLLLLDRGDPVRPAARRGAPA